MRKKISNLLFFLLGGAVGGVISAVVTDKMVDKEYRKAADEEIFEATNAANERIKGYKDQIKELQEKIARQKVTINTLADQVREGSNGDPADILGDEDDPEADPGLTKVQRSPRKDKKHAYEPSKRGYTAYAKRYSGEIDEDPDYSEEAEFPEEPDPEEEEEAIERRGPVIIAEEAFAWTAMDYSKENIDYYIYDGKVVSEDGEYLDNYAGLIGEEWLQHGKNAGDTVYVRNDILHADYCITWIAGYGEEHITVTDDWED